MHLTDKEIVAEIKRTAEQLGLSIDRRKHGGHFCTVYLEAPRRLPVNEQFGLLVQAKTLMVANGVGTVELTRFNNPPFLNKRTRKMEDGHPRHGDPLLEIESVWWEGD